MAESHVQLKREEVVGDEVVLNDINPKTDSESVVDLASGLPLNDSLYRIWNAINNKLTRVVNSVNGRSGIVVLSADDVGLGAVDNVSFMEIQKWVLDQIAKEFKSRRFKLYQSLDQASIDVARNNKSLDGTAFFAKTGTTENNDKLSYIGYIYWDEDEQCLKKNVMSINTIGYADNSIIYNETLIGDGKDMAHGGIGVNIYSGEEALKLRNGVNKDDSGLYIDRDALIPSIYMFDGLYGDGTTGITGGDTTAFLYRENEIVPTGDPSVFKVSLKYDGNSMYSRQLYTKTPLKGGDIVICHFAESLYVDKESGEIFPGIPSALIGYHSAIGTVTVSADKTFIVEFFSIKPKLGWGLSYNNSEHTAWGEPKKYSNLSIKLSDGVVAAYANTDDSSILSSMVLSGNVSGLNVRANLNARDPYNYDNTINPNPADGMRYTNFPNGPTKVYRRLKNNKLDYGGLMILPDSSLCVMPLEGFLDDNEFPDNEGSTVAKNWRAPGEYYKSEQHDATSRGTMENECMLGINLNKVVMLESGRPDYDFWDSYLFSNLSGLRIISNNLESLNADITGDTPESFIINKPRSFDGCTMSGGLAINCGKFMRIEMTPFTDSYTKYYDGGKLTIAIGDGLWDNGDGKLSVAVDEKSALTIKDVKMIDPVTGDESHKMGISLSLGETSLLSTHVEENIGPVLGVKLLPSGQHGSGLMSKTCFDGSPGEGIGNYLSINCNARQGFFINDSNEISLALTYDAETEEGEEYTRSNGLKYDSTNRVMSVQVNDPAKYGGANHGITINEYGTLVASGGDGKVIFKYNNEDYTYSSEDGASITIGRGLMLIPD